MSKRTALFICLAVYLAALAAAVLSGRLMRGGHPLLLAFIADLVATIVVFAFSVIFDNSSVYDPYWSVAPPLLAVYWLANAGVSASLSLRAVLVLILVLVWAFRLTFNWARRWSGMEHEDWRYRDFRTRFGSLYWPVSLLGIHLFPTLIVYLGCLSLYPVMTGGATRLSPFNPIDIAAAAVTIGAITLEAVADHQLHAHRRSAAGRGAILDTGLWSRCRHPNYLGEVTFWWGLYLFCLAASPSRWWFVIGPVAMTALFVGVSVPWMDRHLLSRRDGYCAHMQRVPALLPRLVRRTRSS